jgi:hypothetical protein
MGPIEIGSSAVRVVLQLVSNPPLFEARSFKHIVTHLILHLGKLHCCIYSVDVLDQARDDFRFGGALLLDACHVRLIIFH